MLSMNLSISLVDLALGSAFRFFQFFDQLRRLRMWKMQLLDEHHLFIKYTSEDVVTLRVTDPSQVETINTHTHTHTHTHTQASIPPCAAVLCLSHVFC